MNKGLVWSDKYSVGVEELDKQHQTFFQMINELEKSLKDNAFGVASADGKRKVYSLLMRLRSYALFHLLTEEQMLISWRYKDFIKHKRTHNDYIRVILDMEDRFYEGEISVAAKLLDFLKKWWMDHILTEDKKYVPYAKEGSAEDFFALARQFQLERKYEQALEAYSKSIKKGPGMAKAYFSRGMLHEILGHTEQARKDLEMAVRLDDPNAKALMGLKYQ